MPWQIELFSTFEVVGYDPEFADMDNPRGEQVAEVFYIRATRDDGFRRVLTSLSWRRWQQDEARICAATTDPTSPDHGKDWVDSQPMYGSDFYIANYAESERGLMDDEERAFHDRY